MKKFISACKRLFLLTLLSASAVSSYATYVISVYKDNWSEKYEFTHLSGDLYICENIVIPDYTGDPSDYRYWIGNNEFENGKSANFNLGSSNSSAGTDYLSSCSTGMFSVKIYNDSGDKNYYPHDMTCVRPDCIVQAKGDAIPANTVIFFDNSNGAINTGSIYISVPRESKNGNSTTLNQGGYVPKNDKWYPMTNIGDGIWRAVITTASSYGRVSFWGKDLSTYDDVYESVVAFQIPYTSGKNCFAAEIPSSEVCYNADRKTSYYVSGIWTTRSELTLMASTYSMKESDTKSIDLVANAVAISGSEYTFEYRSVDSNTWNTLAIQSGTTYTLSESSLPGQTTYYRVKYGDYTSKEICISVVVECNAASTKNLLKFDYGRFSSLTGANSRAESTDMSSAYKFKPWPGKVNDGNYAIVPTPYYGGCGGPGSGCNALDDVTKCIGCNDWFRRLGDHSDPKLESDTYGGMLFINFDQNKSQIAYEHILTESEKANFVKGSTLTFSAWFASATAKNPSGGTNIPINMKLSIQYKATGSTSWETRASMAINVKYEDEWKEGITSLYIDDVDGDYRVIIENNAASGVGNDVLIDDISLDLCIPDFLIEFYDEKSSTSYTEYNYEDINTSELIRIPKKDYGFGNDNCVMLVSVDESKNVGEAGHFKYVASMDLDKSGDNYVVNQTAVELMNTLSVFPDYTGKLQAIITESATCTDAAKRSKFISNLEGGSILPFPKGDASTLSSTNMLTFNIECINVINASLTSTGAVCEADGKKENDLPSINVEFEKISNIIDYSLIEDPKTQGEKTLISHKSLDNTQVEAKAFTIDLNELPDIVRTPGNHTFVVILKEYKDSATPSNKICEKSASALTLEVKPMPSYKIDMWPDEVDYCSDYTITVNGENSTSYTWYVNKSNDATTSNWEVIKGADAATYELPADIEDGWQYKVELSNDYCTTITTTPVKVSHINPDAPTTKNYEECAVKKSDSQIVPLSDLVTSPYTQLTWYRDDKTTVVSPAQFDTSVSTDAPVTYYVTDTKDKRCESAPSAVTIFVRPRPADPIAVTPHYNECLDPSVTQLDLFTLISNVEPAITYNFYDATGNSLTSSYVDISTPISTDYSVVAEENGCFSDKVNLTVKVKDYATASDITVDNQEVCKGATATFNASTTTVLPSPLFTWYSDAELTDKIGTGATLNLNVEGDKTIYVTVQNDNYCENVAGDGAEASLTVKMPISSVAINPEEESIVIGNETSKSLVVDPADAEYRVTWSANGKEISAEAFPARPYVTQNYEAILVDACNNTYKATAITNVEWPTVFMPYDQSSTNRDFVVDIEDGGIELLIFDRTGNTMAHTYNGWDGTVNDGNMAMPGVYFYKAILPDGSIKLGTVEIRKK